MKRSWGWIAGLVVLCLFLAPATLTFYTEYLWFASVDYISIFTTKILYQLGTGIGAFLVSFAIFSGVLAWTKYILHDDDLPYGYTVVFLLSLFIGFAMSSAWHVVLRFLNAQAFGTTDPVFGLDVAFYTFTLPFLELAVWLVLVVTALATGAALLIYATRFGVEKYEVVESRTGQTIRGNEFNLSLFIKELRENAFTQLSVLFSVLFILYGISTWLDRYGLLTESYGVVHGVGYTDATITLPLLALTTAVAILGGLTTAVNAYFKYRHIATATIITLVVLSLGGSVASTAVQNYVVEPDEFNKERAYIEEEINATNQGFALERMRESNFAVGERDPGALLQGNDEIIRNIRLWDWRPLLTTYNELQIFRSYYTFSDVDVDRYRVNDELRQVMLSPRELDYSNLPTRSWVNDHLVYTHGYGVTMSPVNQVANRGLPTFFIQDIPPQSEHFSIDTPQLYYGEATNRYSIVNTETREFDYPSGDENVYTNYDGTGGVHIDSLLDRLAYAVRFGDSQIFFSGSITADSQLQLYKNVKERVNAIAPFLSLDDDPYVVVDDGRLKWIIDAYTTAQGYPYSRPHEFKNSKVSYARNSVKIVVDAYNGDVTFYTAEDEPVLATYRNAFPDLFTPMDEMPAGLKDNVRYPEDIFSLQGDVYATYHMRDPQVFYNKEDQWRVPDEITRGTEQRMEPYYVVMRLPGDDEAEFVQIMPYVPRGKENMIGWLAARSDPENYGDIVAYKLTKQELVFGPMQVEARISQDADISQQITLWSQSGSSVFRGNLLALPIDDQFLYVEPLFLKSRDQGSLPELKRVIVAHGDRLTMQPTLEKALRVIAGQNGTSAPPITNVTPPSRPGVLEDIRAQYRDAQDALRTGNLSLYHEQMRELEKLLQE